MTIMFEYIGEGSWIPGIPARDLTEEEAQAAGLEVLRGSSLYEEVKVKSKSKPKKEDVNERSDEAQEDSAGS
jgi:hypothetical protein